MTLVELMVALVIGLVIALASVAALLASRMGYSATDSSSQVRENGRFAADLIQRIAVQAGYEDVVAAIGTKQAGTFGSAEPSPESDVVGYDNALFAPTAFPPNVVNGSRSTGCGGVTDSSCFNGSDVLVLRYQGSSLPGVATGDGSIINCAGIPESAVTASSTQRAYSVFHVARSASGEPALMCSYRDLGGAWTTQPMVQGVEGFQVLYGMDYGAGAVAANAAATGTQDSVPDRFLRADQIIVAGNADATRANWRRVRSLRIGLLIRGPVSSAIDRAASGRTYYPLGLDRSAASDVGSALAIPADGRLRQEFSFTVFLRNPQVLN